MKTLGRREFLRAAAVACGGAALAACQPTVVEVEREVEKIVEREVPVEVEVEKVVEVEREVVRAAEAQPVVRFTGFFGVGDIQDDLQPVLDEFERESGIRLAAETTAGDDRAKMQAMLANIAAGTAQDLHRSWGPHMRALIERDIMMNLTPFIEIDYTDEFQDFSPAQLSSAVLDGHQYGLPQYNGCWAFTYNKDMFDEAGLEYPTADWGPEDVLAASEKMTTRDSGGRPLTFGIRDGFSFEFTVSTVIWSWGAEVHDPEDNRISRLREPLALEAMQWLADLRWRHQVAPTPAEADSVEMPGAGNVFRMGLCGITAEGSWGINGLFNQAGDRFAWDVIPHFRGPTGHRETFATTDMWLMWEGTRHPEAAWEALKFLTGYEYQRLQIRQGFLQPARLSLSPEWLDTISAKAVEVNPKLEGVDFSVFTEAYRYARPMVFYAQHSEAREILSPELDKVFVLGTAKAEEVIPQACEQITDMMLSS